MFILILVVAIILAFIGGIVWFYRLIEKKVARYYSKSGKRLMNENILCQWLQLMESGYDISDYFRENNYKQIAIQGTGHLGKRLLSQLEDKDIEVAYMIDKSEAILDGVPVRQISKDLPEVDVIIITSPYYRYGIEKELKETVDYHIETLEDILNHYNK